MFCFIYSRDFHAGRLTFPFLDPETEESRVASRESSAMVSSPDGRIFDLRPYLMLGDECDAEAHVIGHRPEHHCLTFTVNLQYSTAGSLYIRFRVSLGNFLQRCIACNLAIDSLDLVYLVDLVGPSSQDEEVAQSENVPWECRRW